MNTKVAVGVGYASQEGETVYLAGYNGNGDQVVPGTPVCWDVVASDGVTFVIPASAAFQNFSSFAGIIQDTVGTAEYTHTIVGYGKVDVSSYGISTWIPGQGLVLVDGQTYVAYGTAGQFAGSVATTQHGINITALATNTTANLRSTSVQVRAL